MASALRVVVPSAAHPLWPHGLLRRASVGQGGDRRALLGPLRRYKARGVGWRGGAGALAEDAALRQRLRHAGAVLAWIGRPDQLPVAELAALAEEGPLLAVVEAPLRAAALPVWLQAVARLRLPTLRIALHGVPLCLGAGFTGDLGVALVEPARPLAQPAACAACAARHRCPGTAPGGEVAPLPGAVSNQFDLVEVGPGAGAPLTAEACARALWLRGEGGEVRRFVCDNHGWSPAQLRHVLDELGQAWLDVSTKARLDDFAADLRPLRQLTPAEQLPGGGWRPATWQVAAGDPFAKDEAALRARLQGVRGVVVDIGAGPIRYLRTLADRIHSGAVRYLAVEPDLPALQRTAAALPGAMLTQGVGERLPVRSGVVDHVLMLRSFNHLRDVPAAFAEATRVARPGATLLVVDNVAFGLLRTPAQIERARAISVGETPFEHYRNANADAAVAAIEATGAWQIRRVMAVRPGRANQWTVEAVRREPRLPGGRKPPREEGPPAG